MLTDTQIRQTKPGPKPIKLRDGDGLQLLILPSGRCSWYFRRAQDGREKLVLLGEFPAMNVKAARRARDGARCPAAVVPSAPSFETIARQWLAVHRGGWAAHHVADVLHTLEVEAFPALGALPIDQVTAPVMLASLKTLAERSADLASRQRMRFVKIFDYAIAHGIITSNPARSIGAALPPVNRKAKRPAVLTLIEAIEILQTTEERPGHPITKLAQRVLALTAARPGDVLFAAWSEFDLDAAVWTIPAARMKATVATRADTPDHIVPLAPQTIEALRAAATFSGRSPLVFPSWGAGVKPMSDAALGKSLNDAGFKGRHCPHGWRSTFASVMNEARPAARQAIDLMLAHKPSGVEGRYNRAEFMPLRRELAEQWAAMLTGGLRPAAELLELPRRGAPKERLMAEAA